MAVLLLFFILTLFITVHSKKKDFLYSFITTILYFSSTVLISNELLSVFNAIKVYSISILWIGLNLLIVFINMKNNKINSSYAQLLVKEKWMNFQIGFPILLILTVLIFILLLVQGVIYPPNNWDSMAYHMPRISEWIAHGSFNNFQTHILRQLYQPCFSEYVMMQLQILTGSDVFNNSAQLFFHLFAAITAYAICKELGFAKKQQFFAFILTFLLPEGLLEASSTQNDIFHGFFLLSTIYFTVKIIKENNTKDYLFLGISVGLAFLSKAIAFLYFPITGAFIASYIIYKYVQTKKNKYITNALLTLSVIVIINAPHSFRNFDFSGDIRGTSKEESKDYINEEVTFSNTISIAVKNIGLHLDPLFIGNTGNILIEKFHLITGMDINKKGTNVFDSKFTCNPGWKNHEDTQPNFLHLILITCSIGVSIWMFIKKENTKTNKLVLLLLIHTILQFILFCALLSWEPWNTRLHIPLFYALVPIIVIGFQFKFVSKIYNGIIFLLFIQAFYIIVTNYSREFIHIDKQNSEIGITENRYKKYFTNQPQLYTEYNYLTEQLLKKKVRKIGLIIHNDSWEYPLYAKLNMFEIQPIHLFVENYTKSIAPSKIIPECIVSNTKNEKSINYKKKEYVNSTPTNKFIWLYLPKNQSNKIKC
ncbi:MAG: ArnT family glycosyltransferase [Crocinitomicaceae bacterium]|jgi:hypothetical protein